MNGPRRIALALAGVLAIGVGGATVTALVAGGTGAAESRTGRALTVEEAERLAVARFQMYRGTGTRFQSRVVSGGSAVDLNGHVDFRRRLGLVQATSAGQASFTLQWSASTLLAWPSRDGVLEPPAKLPGAKPEARPLDPAATGVDAVLALLLALGRDRPDNAQLLRRNGAAWLRSEQVDGVEYDVVAGPVSAGAQAGNVVYWIGPNAELRRVDAYLGGGDTGTRVDLDPPAFQTFETAKSLA